jgi:hypothetical protein
LLTAELVRVRKKNGELHIVKIDRRTQERAIEIASIYAEIIDQHVAHSRGELEEALGEVDVEPHEQRLAAGLRKLLDDRCEFEISGGADPEQVRREVWTRAAAARRASELPIDFRRDRVLSDAGEALGLSAVDTEATLFADLRSAQILQRSLAITPAQLVASYDLAQVQAVLLRAVKVTIAVKCARAHQYRVLFRKLKFLRLLPVIHAAGEAGYRVEIDGPFSLFEQVTKYGLQLAMMVPALDGCDAWYLEADVRWGKERERLTFVAEGDRVPPKSSRGAAKSEGKSAAQLDAPASAGTSAKGRSRKGKVDEDESEPREKIALPDDIQALVTSFNALGTLWKVSTEPRVLQLPGVGVCVPDLLFEDRATKAQIFFEVLGYWSREAVWKRVDLVENGLLEKVIFAVSERLRVSEEVLGERSSSSLYVYKGTMSAKAVLDRLERLARPGKATLF